MRSEDYWWLQALTTPPLFTANARRLGQEGVSPAAAARGVAVIERSLAAEGPRTRSQLRERLVAADVPVAGQALVHVLMLACLRGVAVRGPMVGGEQAYALVRDWLGRSPAPGVRDQALGELARRYLYGHGPAADRDLARWAGLPLRDARRGLQTIAAHLRQRPDGLVDIAGRSRPDPRPAPRLLGAFDPLLLGWVSRAPFLGRHQGVITVNGLFRPFALVDGRAAGTWRLASGRVVLQPFAALSGADAAALAADAADVERFLR